MAPAWTSGLARRPGFVDNGKLPFVDVLAHSGSPSVTTSGSVVVRLPDRKLTLEMSDGPDGVRWIIVLHVDDAVASNFGPFKMFDSVAETAVWLF